MNSKMSTIIFKWLCIVNEERGGKNQPLQSGNLDSSCQPERNCDAFTSDPSSGELNVRFTRILFFKKMKEIQI